MNVKVALLLIMASPISINAMEQLVTTQEKVMDYVDDRDRAQVLAIIKMNKDALISNEYALCFDEEKALINRTLSPNTDKKNGTALIKVVRDNNEVAGFMMYEPTCPSIRVCHIGLIAVKKEQRNKGFASALLKSAIQEVKVQGVSKVWAWIKKNDVVAKHIWEKIAAGETEISFIEEEGRVPAAPQTVVVTLKK